LRHNLTTLESDTVNVGLGTMRRRASATRRIAAVCATGRFAPVGACAVLCLLLAHCADSSKIDPRYGVSPSARLVEPGEPVPKGGGVYRVGSPYVVAGRVYTPEFDPNYHAEGLASWYGADFHGRSTANGEIFDLNGITAAHPTLPLPSYVRVTNENNGRSLIVRVNDRGPYHGNRIIDVSMRAAHLLGFTNRGTTLVHIEYVGRAPMEGSDDRILEATLRENQPAPAPWDVRLAATSIVPAFPEQPAPVRNPRLASAAGGVLPDLSSTRPAAQPMSYADAANGGDGTDQLLNGRGLY
jgi:rare lipoprotein A